MLNPRLDFPRHWEVFARTGRVQMRDFLAPDVAERLHRCLRHEVPWSVAIRDDDGVSRTLPDGALGETSGPRYRAMIERANRNAHGKYGFVYESYMMVRAFREGRDPGLVLHRVLAYFNSEPFLAFCRTLAANEAIKRVSAQATRFRPGMFLRAHDDFDAQEGRAVAYVINLSPRWQADWGGLLQFLDETGEVSQTYLPWFNSLSLFRVPIRHCVSVVAPWAEEPRLAITGWWETLPGSRAPETAPQ